MRIIMLFFSWGALISCVNPMASIESEIDQYKIKYPDHIIGFQSQKRTMQYAWSGDVTKRPLLFVHGSPGSWEAWAHFLMDKELQEKFHVIAIDRPGYGGSSAGGAEVSLKSQADDIVEVLKFNQSHLPAILVGHSYGGPVIAKIAMEHSSQVAGLVFVASSVAPELEKTKWYQYPAAWWPIRYLIPTDLRVCNEEIMPLKSELLKMLPFWKNVSVPMAVIQGGQDNLVPPENQDFLVKNLTKDFIVQIIRVPDLNHFVPWKRPDLILGAIHEVNQNIK